MSILKMTLRAEVRQRVASLDDDDDDEVYPQGRLEWLEWWIFWVAVPKLICFDSGV